MPGSISDSAQKTAWYFGCIDSYGHWLFNDRGKKIYRDEETQIPDAWKRLMDGGLLRNGKITAVDGKVFWTCAKDKWLAFYWWDKSVDHRPGSNSGFYVHGFEYTERIDALAFACGRFPQVVYRQKYLLVLADVTWPHSS